MKKVLGLSLVEIGTLLMIGSLFLAVILPNFWAGDRRSKSAQAQSEMRSMQQALESFFIDTDQYPYMSNDKERMEHQYPGLSILDPSAAQMNLACVLIEDDQGIRRLYLTTPVAYMAAIPFDPFRGDGAEYSYGYGSDGYNYYILTSFGPDKAEGLAGVMGGALNEFEYTGSRLTEYLKTGARVGQYTLSQLQFDPSNGIRSKGDLILVGP